jgi:hypothetical protein
MKTHIVMKVWELSNLKRRADKKSETSIELIAHTQTLTQQEQLNGIPLNINTEC